jgi:ketosteroid isomerase-like protein
MRFSILFLAFILLSSCTPSTDQSVASLAAEEENIKAVMVAMWDAIEKGDADRYATYVHPDFTQFLEKDSVLGVGKDREVEAIRKYTSVATNVHTEMIDPRVTIKNNVAWITYYWQDSGIKNGIPFASHGKSTRIFVKENDRWLCIHGHYTLLPVEP